MRQGRRLLIAGDHGYASACEFSSEIKDDDNDPPCIRAKREYEDIASAAKGAFLCTAEECNGDILLFEIDADGPTRGKKKRSGGSGANIIKGGAASSPPMVEKKGGGRYA